MASPEDIRDTIVASRPQREAAVDPPLGHGVPGSAAEFLGEGPVHDEEERNPFDSDDEPTRFPSLGTAFAGNRTPRPQLTPHGGALAVELSQAGTSALSSTLKPTKAIVSRKRAASAKEVTTRKKATATKSSAPAKAAVRFTAEKTAIIMDWFQDCRKAGMFNNQQKHKDFRPIWKNVLERCVERWPTFDWKETSIATKFQTERNQYKQ